MRLADGRPWTVPKNEDKLTMMFFPVNLLIMVSYWHTIVVAFSPPQPTTRKTFPESITGKTLAFKSKRSRTVGMTIMMRNRSQNRTENDTNSAIAIVDEILDALDTMLGVSPLSEIDLKSTIDKRNGGNNNNNSNNVDTVDELQQRATQRELMAPPSDALNKPSVLVFFFLLSFIPIVTLWASVQWGGIKPMGL